MATTAETMHKRVLLAGRSVYWSGLFGGKAQEVVNEVIQSGKGEEDTSKDEKREELDFGDDPDPTFVLLSFFWYAVYAWDESLEGLYSHVCELVSTSVPWRGLSVRMLTVSGHRKPKLLRQIPSV